MGRNFYQHVAVFLKSDFVNISIFDKNGISYRKYKFLLLCHVKNVRVRMRFIR